VRHKWTAREDRELRRMYAKGFPLAEIAFNLRRGVRECEGRLTGKPIWNCTQLRILTEHATRWSAEKIAAYCGRSVEDVKAKLAELGL
jgi:hypothetical protein